MDKQLMFFILSLSCFWLILSEMYGIKYISLFILKILSGGGE